MSYILNALRKSEQERQAVAPDTINSRILSPQPQHPRVSGKLIVALIISNLLILAYFIWVNQRAPSVAKSESAALTSPKGAPLAPPEGKAEANEGMVVSAKPMPAAPVKAAAAQPAAKTGGIDSVATGAEPAPAAAGTKSPSIADMVAAKKAPAPKLPDKPVIEKKPVVAAIDLPSPEDEPETLAIVEPSAEIASMNPAALPAKNDIPFLYELPTEFRREVPRLNINVFVYAKDPAERFVMIDMEKYKTGQMIKDALELKEIRPGSLVVRYHNQTFQIERP